MILLTAAVLPRAHEQARKYHLAKNTSAGGSSARVLKMSGLILSAPSSGAGKTTLTLGLLRALNRTGFQIRGAKSGPDYIDPRFHEAACGQTCYNLDAWAMSPTRIRALAATQSAAPSSVSGSTLLSGSLPEELEPGLSGPILIEGAMGLFDGAPPDGRGATGDLARLLGLPVILILDVARMAQSVAPLALGFANFDPKVPIAGIVLNRVGSDRHEQMLRAALASTGLKVLGAVRRQAELTHPSRHLGLVQASERADLDSFLDGAADLIDASLDINAIIELITAAPDIFGEQPKRIAPPGQRIAIARDAAFAFSYPHLLADWRSAGAEIIHFSPLANDPIPVADFVFLPGGYPELHAGRLASNRIFMKSLKVSSQTTEIYGECGGYMTLGESLTDAEGHRHPMAGLLPLHTSFASRKLHLGYRRLTAEAGPFLGAHTAHEFHYATTVNSSGPSLFQAQDAVGTALEPMGLIQGRVSGSFAHIIDSALP